MRWQGLGLAGLSLVLLTIANLSLAADSNKIEQTKQTLESLKQKLNHLTEQLAKSQEAKNDAADALKKSEQAISASRRRLFQLAQEQHKQSQTLSQLNQQKSQLQQVIDQQREQLGHQFFREYTQRSPHHLQLLLQPENPNVIAREMQYFAYAAKARKLLIQDLQGNLTQVEALNQRTQQTLQQVTVLKNEQQKVGSQLEAEKRAKAQVVHRLASQIASQRQQISRLKRNEQDLLSLFERLNRAPVAKKTPAADKKDKAESSDSSNSTPIAKNDSLPIAGLDGSQFTALKGKLNLPVMGDVMNRFGSSREDTGLTWKGLFIRAAEGSEVKAVAPGRVVFADWMRGFGNLMIVDHGQGYMSLYGNNQALLRKTGDSVKSGDAIATVGNSGGNASHGLYYELRQFSRPFDPLSWSRLR